MPHGSMHGAIWGAAEGRWKCRDKYHSQQANVNPDKRTSPCWSNLMHHRVTKHTAKIDLSQITEVTEVRGFDSVNRQTSRLRKNPLSIKLRAQGVKRVRENCIAPTALVHFVPLYPALTRWANGFRPLWGLKSSSAGHSFSQKRVLTHTLKPWFLP